MGNVPLFLFLNMMKNIWIAALALLSIGVGAQEEGNSGIEWMTFEEAVALHEEGDPRMVFIDVYTDWCGWCKRMDATTFSNPEVAAFMNEHFLNVKLDAEQRETITFRGHDFNFVNSGRRGYHELAANLLQGRLSYPTVVFLDSDFNMIQPVPGYQQVPQFLMIAEYIGDGHYTNTPWDEFKNSQQSEESEG